MVEMTGRLWYDSSRGKRSLDECIQAAQASHRRLLGGKATVCYINPVTHADAPPDVEGVQIRRLTTVSPHYYWIGRNGVEPDEEPEPEEAEPEPEPETGLFDTCPDPNCGAEQLIFTDRCWACGWKRKEPA